jgi:acyl dehydratase
MIFWAEMLSDPNPIHADPDAARALGFGNRTVNPGPVNLAYILNLIAQAFDGAVPSELHARFLGNVMADDAVEAVLTDSRSDGGTAELRRMPMNETVLVVNFCIGDKVS